MFANAFGWKRIALSRCFLVSIGVGNADADAFLVNNGSCHTFGENRAQRTEAAPMDKRASFQ